MFEEGLGIRRHDTDNDIDKVLFTAGVAQGLYRWVQLRDKMNKRNKDAMVLASQDGEL